MIITLKNSGLNGKVVLLASQRSGNCIPAEMTKIFLEESATVYVADTHPEILRLVEAEVERKLHRKIETFPVDFSDDGHIEAFVKMIQDRHGRIDILVTDFGLLEFVPLLKPFHLQNRQDWRRQFKHIAEDTFFWSRAVVPGMIERKSGRIIHITSEAARVGTPHMSVYGAAKAAVQAFARSLAAELARFQITVNCVSLGLQEIQDRNDSSGPSREKLEKIRKMIPLRRFGEPEEIAYMVAFLASDLGAYITGQNLSVSGGMVMV